MAEPEKREQWKEWMEEFQGESDRACAVLGAAFLDEHLRALLEAFFVEDPGRVRELLDGGTAPLGSFSARINLAYALGFLAPSELRDLELVRKVRNDFAHELHGVSFETPAVASRCREMSCSHLDQLIDMTAPRSRFVVSVVSMAQWLALKRLTIRDDRRKVQREVGHAGPSGA